MQKRTCVLCGVLASQASMKQSSINKKWNIVLAASLSLAGFLDTADVGNLVERITSRSKYLCPSHVVVAAQFLSAEVVAAGRRPLSCHVCPFTRQSTGDILTFIPESLVEAINGMSNSGASISGEDIRAFINGARRNYYGTSLWPLLQTEEEGLEEGVPAANAGQQDDSAEPGRSGGAEEEVEVEDVEMVEEVDTSEDEAPSDTEEGSVYEPESSESELSCDGDVGDTDPAVLQKYYMVKGELLMKLFRFCPECGTRLRKAQLKPVGTAAVVRFVCQKCTVRPPGKKWESQEKAVDHPKERMYKGNLVAAVAAIITGLRYVQLARWANQMDLALFSKTFFWNVFGWTKPAIQSVYGSHQRFVLEKMKERYEEGEGLQLAADGAFDSRGYSALIGKVVLSDLRSNLVLHTEVLHRSETENKSNRMEVEGVRRLMRWVVSCGLRVSSLTTDRNRAVGKALREMESEIGAIRHLYDGWHLAKWLGNRLLEVAKRKECEKVGLWVENVKTQLWKAIEVEDGAMTKAIFNTCTMHVINVHEWPLDEDTTGPITDCGHQPLEGSRDKYLDPESRAYREFREVVFTGSFQRDLLKASPYGGTSVCEAKNALDRLYCPKEIFYPVSTYPLRAMMATMHWNTLQLAELSGERKVVREREIQRKYLSRRTKQDLKSPAKHLWRDLVMAEVLKDRLVALHSRSGRDPSEWFAQVMATQEYYECEL